MKTADSKQAFVYRHITLDTNEVFYIGIGVVKRRSWSKNGRNRYWHNVVNKHGFKHEIVQENLTRETAKELEIFLIKNYGRRDLGNGCLVNMTGGGDGMFNLSEAGRLSLIKQKTGRKRTDATKQKIGEAQKRGKHSQAKKVINITNGIIYDCIKDAAESYGIGYHNLKDKLSGRKGVNNNTSLRYYNGDSKHDNI
jgi:hypothetical protein